MNKCWLVAALVASLSSWSCFEIDEEIKLKKDLSGTARIGMKVDLQPMIVVMAAMKKAFGGKEGPPSKAEINAAKKEMLKDQNTSKKEIQEEKARLQTGMPEGVEITKFNVKARGTRMSYDFRFRFDDLTKLTELRLEQKEPSTDGPKNPIGQPFQDLRVVDEGETLLISSVPTNPTEGATDGVPIPEDPEEDKTGIGKTMKKALKRIKVTFKVSVPFQVVESNATKTRGKTLTWTYDIEALQKLSKTETVEGMWVRMEKPKGLVLDHLSKVETGGAESATPEEAKPEAESIEPAAEKANPQEQNSAKTAD